MSRVDLSQRSGLDFVEMAYARQVRNDCRIIYDWYSECFLYNVSLFIFTVSVQDFLVCRFICTMKRSSRTWTLTLLKVFRTQRSNLTTRYS